MYVLRSTTDPSPLKYCYPFKVRLVCSAHLFYFSLFLGLDSPMGRRVAYGIGEVWSCLDFHVCLGFKGMLDKSQSSLHSTLISPHFTPIKFQFDWLEAKPLLHNSSEPTMDITFHGSLVAFHGTKFHVSKKKFFNSGFPFYGEHLGCILWTFRQSNCKLPTSESIDFFLYLLIKFLAYLSPTLQISSTYLVVLIQCGLRYTQTYI